MNNIDEKIKEIVNFLKEYILYAKLGGSIYLPIKNKRDNDLIIVCKDKETTVKCMSVFRKNFLLKDLMDNYSLDVHFICKEEEDIHLLENPFYLYLLKNSLLTNYKVRDITIAEVLEGKEETLRELKSKIFSNKKLATDEKYKNKIWYRTYITLCMYKNCKFEFTAEQIENINILHDRKEEDLCKRKLLIDQIIKEIELWQ